jgi:signal transduction histidine kinase
MIGTGAWRRIAGFTGRLQAGIARSPSRQDQSLRRIGLRLALQTVVLFLVMVIALEVVVYVFTEQSLIRSLENTLRQRAIEPDLGLCHQLSLPCNSAQGGPGPGPGQNNSGPPGGQGNPNGPGNPNGGPNGQGHGNPNEHGNSQGGGPQPPVYFSTPYPNEASAVYIDTHLTPFHSEGSLGQVLLDKSSARAALRTGTEQCCSVKSYNGRTFLVYSAPLRNTSGAIAAVVQTSVSEHQYQDTLNSLLEILLVGALLGLIGSGAVSALLAQRALSPIRTAMQRQRDFVADAAHELRTPLAIMRTVGEVGMAAPSTDELQATVAQMLGENQHLTRLVDDLSLLARTDSNAVSIERRPADLSALINDTAAELSYLAEERGVTLDRTIVQNIQVQGDALRLRQLLLILLDNALKHTPDGGTVRLELSARGGRARLQVVDSGPGIAAADLPHIFDRFYQADHARTGQGSGLGLSIARWIVDAHGGSIQAGNAAPHGATFTVTLPLLRSSGRA